MQTCPGRDKSRLTRVPRTDSTRSRRVVHKTEDRDRHALPGGLRRPTPAAARLLLEVATPQDAQPGEGDERATTQDTTTQRTQHHNANERRERGTTQRETRERRPVERRHRAQASQRAHRADPGLCHKAAVEKSTEESAAVRGEPTQTRSASWSTRGGAERVEQQRAERGPGGPRD